MMIAGIIIYHKNYDAITLAVRVASILTKKILSCSCIVRLNFLMPLTLD